MIKILKSTFGNPDVDCQPVLHKQRKFLLDEYFKKIDDFIGLFRVVHSKVILMIVLR